MLRFRAAVIGKLTSTFDTVPADRRRPVRQHLDRRRAGDGPRAIK